MTDKNITICGHGSATPSTKNLNTYSTSRYNQKAPNGVRKGIVAVRRLRGLTDKQRPSFTKFFKTLLGRNKYNQARRGYVYTTYSDGKYYSDCSSSGIATFKQIGFKFPWLYNTAAIYTEKDFETVDVKISGGHIKNPEVLKVGDCILFAGSDPSRPKQIGHVEYVYSIKADKGITIAKPTLRRGMEDNEQVEILQRNLNKAKMYGGHVAKLVPDGDFGELTEAAVIRFQKKYGLTQDGIYGPKTYAKLNEVLNG